MKQLFFTISILFLLFAEMAFAGPLDVAKDWIGSVGWQAAAAGLSALLLIGGLATRAVWLSGVFLILGTICLSIGTGLNAVLAAVGGALNWIGSILQDGKLTSDELKQARPQWIALRSNIGDSWATMKDTVRAAWKTLEKPPGK